LITEKTLFVALDFGWDTFLWFVCDSYGSKAAANQMKNVWWSRLRGERHTSGHTLHSFLSVTQCLTHHCKDGKSEPNAINLALFKSMVMNDCNALCSFKKSLCNQTLNHVISSSVEET